MFTFRKKKWHSARHVGNPEEHSMIHQILEGTLKLVAKPKHKEVILNALTAQVHGQEEKMCSPHILCINTQTKSEKL